MTGFPDRASARTNASNSTIAIPVGTLPAPVVPRDEQITAPAVSRPLDRRWTAELGARADECWRPLQILEKPSVRVTLSPCRRLRPHAKSQNGSKSLASILQAGVQESPETVEKTTCGRLEALFSWHFSDTAPHVGHFFANRTALPVPRVSLPAPAAPRSAATCRRTAAGLDVLPPAGASSTWHASRAGPRSSPAAAGDS